MTPLARLLAAAACAAALSAHADRADREKPIGLEADRVTIDDKKKTHLFEGHVRLSQGSLLIQADRILVTRDPAGYQKGVATGEPAAFREKREGREDFIEGQARRIEHDTRSGRTEFFDRALVRSGGDEVRGNYIRYDSATETYLVDGGRSGRAGDGRVRAIIQPRRGDSPSAAPDTRKE